MASLPKNVQCMTFPKSNIFKLKQISFYSSLFGDEAETVFWEVALHYLRREKARLLCAKHKVTN